MRSGSVTVTQDLYKILQVDPDADAEVIEAAYRRLARRYHPDVNHAAWAEVRMRELNIAYQTLRHPRQRALYDGLRTRTNGARRDGSSPQIHRCYRNTRPDAIESCKSRRAGRLRPPAPRTPRPAAAARLGL